MMSDCELFISSVEGKAGSLKAGFSVVLVVLPILPPIL